MKLEMINWQVLIPIAIIGAIAWVLVRLIAKLEKSLPMDKKHAKSVVRILRFVVVVIAILLAIQATGYPISGLLAIGGVGTVVLGLAAKDTLANFFGAFVIYFDRPFVEGDWIRSPDREIEGYVESIGWRLTKIRSFEQHPLYVPNSVFTNVVIENPSRMLSRRIKEVFRIRYSDIDKLPAILKDIQKMLDQNPALDHTQHCMVNFIRFGESAIECLLHVFTKATQLKEYREAQQRLFFEVNKIIQHHGAQLASIVSINKESE